MAGGEDGAEEISDSVYVLDGGLNGVDTLGVGVELYDDVLRPKLVWDCERRRDDDEK
jgi:hypothetical protein